MWKFGNPVILDSKVFAPKNSEELWSLFWPPKWSFWFLLPLVGVGTWLAFRQTMRWPGPKSLWIFPLIWFGWQLVSTTHTVDSSLSWLTIRHFAGIVACYFLGTLVFGNERGLRILLIGLLAGFAFCLVKGVNQKFIEFPQEQQFLIEGERTGWTNLPPEAVLEMKQMGTIITTNGVDIANPLILKKNEKGRVFGTLVYPNALAGAVLLLLPLSIVVVMNGSRRFRPLTRMAALGLTFFLGVGALFWTGSKSGWLIALSLIAIWLFRLSWPTKMKWLALGLMLVLGLGLFGVRFRTYFASGATSVGARFDYWRAAVQTTLSNPVVGTGPGTFQRPYEQIKSPEAEMARLTHNDYLEQFCDSGLIGGLSYFVWLAGLMIILGNRIWKSGSPLYFAVFIGCLGWFVQGLSEFGLYIPALAWPAFVLVGSLLRLSEEEPPILR